MRRMKQSLRDARESDLFINLRSLLAEKQHMKEGKLSIVTVAHKVLREACVMSLSRMLYYIIGCVFTSVAYAQEVKIVDKEEYLFSYDEELDQEVVANYEFGCTKVSPGVAVAKEYVSKRKAKANVERSQYVDYVIINEGAHIKLLTAPADVNLKIGRIEKSGEHYFIPVLDEVGNRIDIYSYSTADKKVLKIKSIENDAFEDEKYIFASNVAVLVRSANTVSIVPNAAESVDENARLDIYKKENAKIIISDVTEYGEKLFVVGSMYPDASPYEGALWMAEVDRRKKPARIVVHEVGLEGYIVPKLSFVNSSHREPSVMVVKFKEGFREPEVNLMGSDLNLIWKSKKRYIEADQFTIAGVCDEEYLIVGQLKGKENREMIEVKLINSAGGTLSSKDYSMGDISSLNEIMVTPSNEGACIMANFNKIEPIRRPDGWYSWVGYRIDSIRLACNIGR